MKSQLGALLFHCTPLFCVFFSFFVFCKTKSEMIENQMVNFEPGEYMRKMVFQSVTQAAQKKKSEHSLFMTIFPLVQMLYHWATGHIWGLRPLNCSCRFMWQTSCLLLGVKSVNMCLCTTIEIATIPEKTTWEFVPLHAHYGTQQHYYNNNWLAVPNPPPPRSMLFPTNM